MKYFNLIRIKDWSKNLFCSFPSFFGGDILSSGKLITLFSGFLAFSFVASSIYIFNDLIDLPSDKLHPSKSKRPLASGQITSKTAIIFILLLYLAGSALAYILKLKFFFFIELYFVINIFYTLILKKIAIVDILMIATGFILRIKSGGTLSDVAISEWLMVMVFLLSLFMGFAKRRDDLLLLDQTGKVMRKTITSYNLDFVNACIIMISGIIIVAYLMYSLSPETQTRFGTHRIYYTSLFVILGVVRYLQIIFVLNKTGSPTEIFLKDRFIQISILLWVISFYFFITYPDFSLFQR